MKKILDQAIDFILAMLLIAMTCIVFIQVFFRYVLNAPLPWPEETARMMIVWLSFIGGYMALRENKHIGFNLLVKKFPVHAQLVINIIGKVLIIIFLFVVIKEGLAFSRKYLAITMPYTGISVGWVVYSVFPVSGALMLLQTIYDLSRAFTAYQQDQQR
jgi:TRAP-type C4-dicarboxylate transport system permease small subunit